MGGGAYMFTGRLCSTMRKAFLLLLPLPSTTYFIKVAFLCLSNFHCCVSRDFDPLDDLRGGTGIFVNAGPVS